MSDFLVWAFSLNTLCFLREEFALWGRLFQILPERGAWPPGKEADQGTQTFLVRQSKRRPTDASARDQPSTSRAGWVPSGTGEGGTDVVSLVFRRFPFLSILICNILSVDHILSDLSTMTRLTLNRSFIFRIMSRERVTLGISLTVMVSLSQRPLANLFSVSWVTCHL